jgi:hypothetical protein
VILDWVSARIKCEHVGEITQYAGIDPIGLGQPAQRLCNVPSLPGIEPRHIKASALQRGDNAALISPRFTQDSGQTDRDHRLGYWRPAGPLSS